MPSSSSSSSSSRSLCFSLIILSLVSLLSTDNFFAYHAPGAIAHQLQEHKLYDNNNNNKHASIYPKTQQQPSAPIASTTSRSSPPPPPPPSSSSSSSSSSSTATVTSTTLVDYDNDVGEHFAPLTTEQIGLLFTVYSAPNVIMVLIGGIMIDKYGVHASSLFFNSLIVIGMIIFNLAPADNPIPCFMIGRLLLGLGGESICACSMRMLSSWFKSDDDTETSYLTAAMGFCQAAQQLFGSAAVFYFLPLICSKYGLRASFTVTTCVCVLSLVCNIIYVIVDSSYGAGSGGEYEEIADVDDVDVLYHDDGDDKISDEEEEKKEREKANEQDAIIAHGHGFAQIQGHHDHAHAHGHNHGHGHSHSHSHSSPGPHAHAHAHAPPHHHRHRSPSYSSTDAVADHTSVLDPLYYRSCFDCLAFVNDFSPRFYAVLLSHCLLDPILYTFTAFGPLYFSELFGYSMTTSSRITSYLYVALLFSPVLGFVIDHVGYRLYFQLAAVISISFLFIALHFNIFHPALCMIALGIAFGITESNTLSMIALSAPDSLQGTAFGLAGCGISIALFIEPAAVGYIYDRTGSFTASIYVFVGLAACATVCTLFIIIFDKKTRGRKWPPLMTDIKSLREQENDRRKWEQVQAVVDEQN